MDFLKKIIIPQPFAFYTTLGLLYLLVLNQFFLGSAVITILVVLVSIVAFYSLAEALKEGEGRAGAIPDGDVPGSAVAGDEERRAFLTSTRDSIYGLCDRATKMRLGTDAQVFSLEETTTSIGGISDSIRKTVTMIDRLSPSAEKASRSVVGLVDAIGDISNHNREVIRVLEKSIDDIQEMSTSVRMISENFTVLSRSSVESTRGIKEINTFAKNIEKSAGDSFKMSEDVARESEHGADSVRKTIESMENLKSIVSESSSVIKTLGDRSGEIGNIIKFIDSVATRINLLALNASIIASQAGEHGKPFAVVAGEMEKLASQTSTSTVEISQLIDAIQNMVQSTVQANEVGMWGVEEGVSLANKAGEILKKIQSSSRASVEMSESILSATSQQVKMADDVLSAIQEEATNLDIAGKSIESHVNINRSVDESATRIIELTKEVKEATEKQHQSSIQIADVISEVITVVEDLTNLTNEQEHDSEQIKQATEIINFISTENINAIKDLADTVETVKNDFDEASKPFLN